MKIKREQMTCSFISIYSVADGLNKASFVWSCLAVISLQLWSGVMYRSKFPSVTSPYVPVWTSMSFFCQVLFACSDSQCSKKNMTCFSSAHSSNMKSCPDSFLAKKKTYQKKNLPFSFTLDLIWLTSFQNFCIQMLRMRKRKKQNMRRVTYTRGTFRAQE